jgi:multiple sugar transport system permease protein
MRTSYLVLKYTAVLLWSGFVIFPFLWMLSTSFKDANGVMQGARWLPWLGYEPSLAGWQALFGGPGGVNIVRPFANSLVVTLSGSAIALVLGTLAAYGLSRFGFRAGPMRNGDITFFFVSQRIMPPIVLAIPFFLMLGFLGLLDTMPGLILIYVAMLMPIAVWVMVDFFASIPRGLDEMAWLDGCTPLATFLRVILPNALPGIVVAGMFCLIFGWNDFFFAFTMTFTQVQLLPVTIVALNSSVTPWWSLSAAAIVSVAPLAVLAFVVERFLSRGGLAGAVR